MARFRLRFLLQEFDLPPGDTLLGRSPECHVTIEDPLVSRQHARVRIDGDRATVEDLGSRNGVRVNGVLTKGATPLAPNDRVRIGTQELVFCLVQDGAELSSKRTGFLRHCPRCQTPFPEEMVACPSCGWGENSEETSDPGVVLDDSRPSWTLQLLVEVLDKALTLSREPDAERIMTRAASAFEERLAAALTFDRAGLDALAEGAVRLASKQRSGRWAVWALDAYGRLGWVPPATLLDRVSALPHEARDEAREAGERLLRTLRTHPGPSGEEDRLARLELLGRG